jgi:isopentenyl diphosphate isomerase/L-lactate dehydrogenase-like FMN-dependent dehydrogenase
MDGGIRRGADIVKARAIAILKAVLMRTMRLLGCASMNELDVSFVDAPSCRA